MLRHTAILMLLTAGVGTTASGQSALGRQSASQSASQIDPQLRQLLELWSENSGQIRKLKGEVLRRTYETTFAVERMAEGRFYYEAPDKGRLDVIPAHITKELLAARQRPDAKVRRDDKEQPFKLKMDGNERWICDGKRVFMIDDDDKEAYIQELPAALQGENIMNSPLPFLFGMPPEQAVKRFHLRLKSSWTKGDRQVQIEAVPRLRQDGENWKQADIILDTKTWLPLHVRLLHPSGDKTTVYSFSNIKANGVPWWRNPFKPNLRDYDVHVLSADEEPTAVGQRKPDSPVIPDLTGLAHTLACEKLKRLGIAPENIKKLRGGPATRAQDEFRVREQEPPPRTRIQPDTKVLLYLWEKRRQ